MKSKHTDQIGVIAQLVVYDYGNGRLLISVCQQLVWTPPLRIGWHRSLHSLFTAELFQPAGAVTQCQVLSAFGNVTVGLHKDVITALVVKVQVIKTDVRSWGLHQV